MTEPITTVEAAVAALPMPAGPARPIAQLDVDLHELRRRIARQKFANRMARLDDLLAHPEYATAGTPAPVGERAEWGHLLYDADEDATTPAFPYPTPLETP
ncbi:hypothetical protein ACIBBD_02305 [Streptomyces sp. NPDC051315]|uniref:hypothetical protein n=1 Tax=Streptomyces sp. NPDC051315 TaxID=3365650 RepID=UPI00378A88B0